MCAKLTLDMPVSENAQKVANTVIEFLLPKENVIGLIFEKS